MRPTSTPARFEEETRTPRDTKGPDPVQVRDFLQMTEAQLKQILCRQGQKKLAAIAALIKTQSFMMRLKSDTQQRVQRSARRPKHVMPSPQGLLPAQQQEKDMQVHTLKSSQMQSCL